MRYDGIIFPLNDGNGHPVLQLSCSSQPENIRQELADCRASAHLKARRSPRFLVYQLDCGHVHHASVAQAKWKWRKNQKESCALNGNGSWDGLKRLEMAGCPFTFVVHNPLLEPKVVASQPLFSQKKIQWTAVLRQGAVLPPFVHQVACRFQCRWMASVHSPRIMPTPVTQTEQHTEVS